MYCELNVTDRSCDWFCLKEMMDQARKDTSGVKLEVNERFVYFSDFKQHLVTRCLVSLILIKIKLVGTVFQIKKHKCMMKKNLWIPICTYQILPFLISFQNPQ